MEDKGQRLIDSWQGQETGCQERMLEKGLNCDGLSVECMVRSGATVVNDLGI